MSVLRESGPDDQQLVRYLLHLLPEEEADRLDEISISDDALAWRLREVENDLVDAYVRGALAGETLQRFESSYLSSERRREKVRFAGSFLGAVNQRPGAAPRGVRATWDDGTGAAGTHVDCPCPVAPNARRRPDRHARGAARHRPRDVPLAAGIERLPAIRGCAEGSGDQPDRMAQQPA